MTTLEYFLQPDLTPSCMRFLATGSLLIIDDSPAKRAPGFVLRRKIEIFHRLEIALTDVKKGCQASNRGTYGLAKSESIRVFNEFTELSDEIRSEAKNQYFPCYLENYCVTLGKLTRSEQPSAVEIYNLKLLLKKISPDYDECDKVESSEAVSSQPSPKPALQSLSYISP